ncbi:MAG: tRNA (N6-isopentenyl adenosine(37)-C2)-methylthiotransferase MiaB, partial [Bacilli bacterium]|nr:tRNA (N6-isopentenyl adenosine(37)-C2)-methylthiotransferase MiaB [Bacilli bacterium]MCH4235703.1 tRNA (N6-isopentenyl adenosine(37)-C2)-methylthiotransferase MiaB [Bacilli bacterium]
DDYNEADVIIINTCAVRENAEDKVFGEVGSLKSLKAKRPGLIVAVGGCMVQQGVIVDTLKDKYAQVDLIFGTHNIEYLPDYLNEIITTRKRIIDVISKPGEVIENLPSVRIDRYKAFVNIIYGCDKFCTYCIVPYTRGRERSRKKEEVIKECQQLVADGYQEITLLGQNVNAYGKDLTDGTDFAELLEAVAKLGIPRLRFTTSHPWDFSSKMIEVIGKYSNIMKAIHLPFQSGNANILRRMGRRYTPDSYRALVDEMKAKIPGVSFTTDIIVGFPNETYEEFCDTKKMVEYVEFDNAFTFIYSPRPGTPASKLEDNVSEEEKHRRFDELVDTVEKCATLKAEQMVGKIYPILVDSVSKRNDEVMSGYTENNKLVNFPGTVDLIGKIVNVRILESKVYSLRGELVSE